MATEDDPKRSGLLRGLVDNGSSMMGKAMDKGTDVAMAMMTHLSGLIAKLSDDIGLMADRILMMEERIGLMADRILKTEALMANLTAALADKELARPDRTEPPVWVPGSAPAPLPLQPPLLSLAVSQVTAIAPPSIQISGDPPVVLLYVSTSPAFRDGETVVSRVQGPAEQAAAWQRSVQTLAPVDPPQGRQGPTILSLAVRAVTDEQGILSPLSNSVDVNLAEKPTEE